MQTTTDSASNGVPSASPTIDDCPGAEILSTSSSSEEKLLGVLENEEEKILDTNDGKTIDGQTEVKEEEQRQDSEDSTAEKQNGNSKVEQNETVVTIQNEETAETNATESTKEKVEENEENGESLAAKIEDADADIEWLTPFSKPSMEETEETASEEGEDAGGKKSAMGGALKTLKKGAVSIVGGSMVGVGLVMIPLPTPFGAVVASSGLAVLGTEFDEAKELNDKLIGGAKGHLNKARDTIVKGIEKMNKDDDDDDKDGSSSSANNGAANSNDKLAESEAGDAGNVIKVNAADALSNEGSVGAASSEDGNNSENETESPPVWLHMNPIERERQEKLAKQKYKRDRQTTYEQVKEGMTKRTGKFLSKTLLPLIKKKEKNAAAEGDAEQTTTESETDEKTDSVAVAQEGNDSEKNVSSDTVDEAKQESEDKVVVSI